MQLFLKKWCDKIYILQKTMINQKSSLQCIATYIILYWVASIAFLRICHIILKRTVVVSPLAPFYASLFELTMYSITASCVLNINAEQV